MNVYFVDTSALAKRYIEEKGTDWLLSWILPEAENIVVISDITTVEMISLLARRLREGTLTTERTEILRTNFLLHSDKEYLLIPVDEDVLQRARQLLQKHTLRTLDALQLASALVAAEILEEPVIFVAADQNLLTAAANEKFVTDDPMLHT